jgi:glutaryl-CoA dehydrogenase
VPVRELAALLDLGSHLSEEERLIQKTVTDFVAERVRPNIAAWFGQLGRAKDAGKLRPEQVSLGKLNNVREAIEIARTCRTILGGSGITTEYPVLRHANNLESVLTYEGTSEVHQLTIGQALTGVSAFR